MAQDTDLPMSPCVRNCCLDEQDTCLGCYRTLEEILAWGKADNAKRRQILDSAKQRRRSALNRRDPDLFK